MIKKFLPLVLVMILSAPALAVTRAGTSIESQGFITFSGITVSSEVLYTTVSQIYGLSMTLSSSEANIAGGGSFSFPVSVMNVGNGTAAVNFFLAVTPEGWTVCLFVDDNRDDVRQDTENTYVPSSIVLAEDADYKFFIELEASDTVCVGTSGYGTVICSTEVNDGLEYFGVNGILYGGNDTPEATARASVESLGKARIWRDDAAGKIEITWAGGPADVYYRTDFGLTFETAATEALNASSPFTSEAIFPRDGSTRYYRVAVPGTTDFADTIMGKFDATVVEGVNHMSLPLVPYETQISSVIGSQVDGADNSFDADRIWLYNPLVQAQYDFAWLVDGVGEPYDGQWYSGNDPTTLSIEADVGFVLQIRPGHSTDPVTFVGTVSEVDRYIPVGVGLNFVGTCFPVEVPLGDRSSAGDSNLWESGAIGADNSLDADRVWSYNPLVQAKYDIAWLVDGVGEPYDGEWYSGNNPTTIKLVPGKGYWIQVRPEHSGFEWHYPRPY